MKLKPLSQWICDTCGDVIQEPRHGWFEWQWDAQWRSYGFRICHHNPNTPGYDPMNRRLCALYNGPDLPLEDVSGANGLPFILSMLDLGEFRDPERSTLMKVVDIREWVFTCR